MRRDLNLRYARAGPGGNYLGAMRNPIEKVLLVNYAGYWLTANAFTPDCSLAGLAGVLQEAGVPVEVVEFQTPDQIGKVMEFGEGDHAATLLSQLAGPAGSEDRVLRAYCDQRARGQLALEAELAETLLAKIEHERVGLVGFKVWAGNGVAGVMAMARAIRTRFPRVRIVAGGPAIHFLPELWLKRCEAFDYAVYGEGEEAILRLARGEDTAVNMLSRRTSLTVAGSRQRKRNLDDLPWPTYDRAIYPAASELYRTRIIDDSRGCFNKCSFCAHTSVSGRGAMRKSPPRVVDEMQYELETNGIHYFRLAGSNPPWKFLVAIAREILDRRLDLCFSAFSSMNNTRVQDMPLLARAGLRALLYGIESGDRDYLARIHNKDNGSDEHILSVTRAAMQAGIFVALSVISPSPSETPATREATFSLLARAFESERHGSIFISPAFLSPQTQWFNRMEHYGFAFADGFDAERYLELLLHFDNNFLLPKSAAQDLPYSLDGKPWSVLLTEAEAFSQRVAGLGVPTNIDDAAYMLSLMGNMAPDDFKQMSLAGLVRGGRAELRGMIGRLNTQGDRTRVRAGPRLSDAACS